MTDDDFPQDRIPLEADPQLDAAAAEPLDPSDEALLQEVAEVFGHADPVPDDLVQRIQFSVALDQMYTEVARITRVPADALAVRGERVAGMRTETLTFSADRLTAMVTVTRSAPERIRVDGWTAPPTALRIGLRMQEGSRETVSDESGRFVFEDLPEGFAQLTFHATGEDGATVVTPLFQL
jgi:hypothetical protein